MQKNTIASVAISIALIGGALYFVSHEPSKGGAETRNVQIRNGVQYVTITAKGGFSPRTTDIRAGIPTKLIVRTNNTYDCSASLMVQSVGFRKILQPTGEETIDLGVLEPGEKTLGVCGMGMYSFQINAN